MTLSTLDLDGLRFEYDDVPGLDDRAPLLFLHEGLGSVGLWRGFHQRIAVASGRRAVAYSRLGHGFSDLPPGPRPTTFMTDEAKGVLPRLVDRLGLDRPVLVGHSDGGTIALLAAAGPVPVTGVVVLAPHTFVEQRGIDGIAAARTAYDDGGLRERMARHHRDADVTFRSWNDVWLAPEFRDWDVRAELSGITAPVLAVQGDDDAYGTLAHVESVRDNARGDVRIVELGCGHSPHLELPDDTDRAVVDFLSGLP
ncbi:alpha/beta fold hydrolase [Pseudonocardia endophytica]|uniref:Pimeloyl-ACP methyl ester carboxylesterase n=1 Tax=Pseudonocardia endophytica TaxID=401976 RepID=A0A4R1HL16_PSEEN|nr:alpha/beta hydrolase [Pseudonocardia endophytica]TCK22648.1 pimeloyl-ACP methyl ester carboxylesterase [Pseudonocardia endophytica]